MTSAIVIVIVAIIVAVILFYYRNSNSNSSGGDGERDWQYLLPILVDYKSIECNKEKNNY